MLNIYWSKKKIQTNIVETNATHTLYCIHLSHRVLGFRDNKIKLKKTHRNCYAIHTLAN
jgi:hypothetical protein